MSDEKSEKDVLEGTAHVRTKMVGVLRTGTWQDTHAAAIYLTKAMASVILAVDAMREALAASAGQTPLPQDASTAIADMLTRATNRIEIAAAELGMKITEADE